MLGRSLIIAAVLLACSTSRRLRSLFVRETTSELGSSANEVVRRQSSKAPNAVSRGLFDGTKVQYKIGGRANAELEFWARQLPTADWVIEVEHFADDELVFSAEYNHVNGVSDDVYYVVDGERFCVGCGRGSGWKEDEEHLVEVYKEAGMKKYDYATRSDYNGVGHFKLDRGHQCPVAAFNAEEDIADLTNMPTNLTPQNWILNQQKWRFLESDLRTKAVSNHLTDVDGNLVDVEVMTGPIYTLPRQFLVSSNGEEYTSPVTKKTTPLLGGLEKWEELLDFWCSVEKGEIEHEWLGTKSYTQDELHGDKPKKSHIRCVGRENNEDLDVNNMWIDFLAQSHLTPLRIPLGYYKVYVVPAGSGADHDENVYCAFVMDQTGQCMLTNLEDLSEVTKTDFTKADFTKKKKSEGIKGARSGTAKFCIPPDTPIRDSHGCMYLHRQDLDDVDEDRVMQELRDEAFCDDTKEAAKKKTIQKKMPEMIEDRAARC